MMKMRENCEDGVYQGKWGRDSKENHCNATNNWVQAYIFVPMKKAQGKAFSKNFF